MAGSLDWRIGLITKNRNEASWQELYEAVKLFFNDVHFEHPDQILRRGFRHNFVFTDNKHIFIKAQEGNVGCLYLPVPTMRQHIAELFRTMAFSFLTPEAYKD
jgi:hypothetical protein